MTLIWKLKRTWGQQLEERSPGLKPRCSGWSVSSRAITSDFSLSMRHLATRKRMLTSNQQTLTEMIRKKLYI